VPVQNGGDGSDLLYSTHGSRIAPIHAAVHASRLRGQARAVLWTETVINELFSQRRTACAKNMKHSPGPGRGRALGQGGLASSIRLVGLPSGLLVDASIFVTNSRRAGDRARPARPARHGTARHGRIVSGPTGRLICERLATRRRRRRLLRQEAVQTLARMRSRERRTDDTTCSILLAAAAAAAACLPACPECNRPNRASTYAVPPCQRR